MRDTHGYLEYIIINFTSEYCSNSLYGKEREEKKRKEKSFFSRTRGKTTQTGSYSIPREKRERGGRIKIIL